MALRKKVKQNSRWRVKMRSRDVLKGTSERPRICVYRSAKHIYAQIIADETGKTLVNASTLDKEVLSSLKNISEKNSSKSVAAAREVGKVLAKRAKALNIESVLFDRNGFLYHGRIAGVAEGAREGGLKF